jgi:hypothetical protein
MLETKRLAFPPLPAHKQMRLLKKSVFLKKAEKWEIENA